MVGVVLVESDAVRQPTSGPGGPAGPSIRVPLRLEEYGLHQHQYYEYNQNIAQ